MQEDENYQVRERLASLETDLKNHKENHIKDIGDIKEKVGGIFKRIQDSVAERSKQFSEIQTELVTIKADMKISNAKYDNNIFFKLSDYKKVIIALIIGVSIFLINKIVDIKFFSQPIVIDIGEQ